MYEKKESNGTYRIITQILCLVYGIALTVLGVLWASKNPSHAVLISIAVALCFIALSVFTILGLSSLEKKKRIKTR